MATGVQDDSQLVLIDNEVGKSTFANQIKQIMDQPRTGKVGFFTMNGRVLIHLLRVMQELKHKYPEEFGVGSYEDLDWMEIIQPGISCIHQDSFNLGVTAVNTLVDKLQNKNSKVFLPKLIKVPTTIKKRESY